MVDKKDIENQGYKIVGDVAVKVKEAKTKKKRVKHSLGICKYFHGTINNIEETPYVIDNSRAYYVFDIIPVAKPRMTRKDKFVKRDRTTQYWEFVDKFKAQAEFLDYKMANVLEAVFFVPMPESWSKKKKEKFNGMPCKHIPDTDNYTKAIKDALNVQDKEIWWDNCRKHWAFLGSIIIFR